MSRVCGATNLITTIGPSGKGGFVATAMCSVTDTPPTLLVCMNKSSQQSDLFLNSGKFCVNVLSHEGQSLAKSKIWKSDKDWWIGTSSYREISASLVPWRISIAACIASI
ncbi:MAG: flavin reductase [Alphaproteobacteria bacterium]